MKSQIDIGRGFSRLLVVVLLGSLIVGPLTTAVQAQNRQRNVTTVIADKTMSKADLQTKLGSSVEITERGTDEATGNRIFEVRGDADNVARTLEGDRRVNHMNRHAEFTQEQLAAMQKVIDAVLTWEGILRFGSGGMAGAARPMPHPVPRIRMCWFCEQCLEPDPPPLMPPPLLPDCPRPDNLDDLYDEWLKWATLTNVLTELLDAYNWFDYWSGVGNMVQDMISAAGLLLPGAGSVAARGLNMLIQMGISGALDAAMGALLEATGLEDFNSRGAITSALGIANGLRKAALDAYNAVWFPYIECQNKVNLENARRQADLDAWEKVKDTYLANWAKYQACINNPNRYGWRECK